eukprot:COSAG06_NODE_128_length_22642_cov_195.891452_21_plen_324_part_00
MLHTLLFSFRLFFLSRELRLLLSLTDIPATVSPNSSTSGVIDTVVAKGGFKNLFAEDPQDPFVSIKLLTAGRCKCPFRHKVDNQCGLTLQYLYLDNRLTMHCSRVFKLEDELNALTFDRLKARCTRAGYNYADDKKFAKMETDEADDQTLRHHLTRGIIATYARRDPCIQAVDNDLTEKMFQRFISCHSEDIVFLKEKGPKFAIPTTAGNYDLYVAQHKNELMSANASTVLSGCDHNFRPWIVEKKQAMRDLPFEWCFKLLEKSPWRNQKNKVVFFPARAPYENVDAQTLQGYRDALSHDNLNLFMGSYFFFFNAATTESNIL